MAISFDSRFSAMVPKKELKLLETIDGSFVILPFTLRDVHVYPKVPQECLEVFQVVGRCGQMSLEC